jgi:hypothetical protein
MSWKTLQSGFETFNVGNHNGFLHWLRSLKSAADGADKFIEAAVGLLFREVNCCANHLFPLRRDPGKVLKNFTVNFVHESPSDNPSNKTHGNDR